MLEAMLMQSQVEDTGEVQVYDIVTVSGTGSPQVVPISTDLTGSDFMIMVTANAPAAASDLMFDSRRDDVSAMSIAIIPNADWAESAYPCSIDTTTAFQLTVDGTHINNAANTYTYYIFKVQPRFFDVILYEGDGTTEQTISHTLGIPPGVVLIKPYQSTGNWDLRHIDQIHTWLNLTDVGSTNDTDWWSTGVVTDAHFKPNSFGQNATGVKYLAYVFAHDEGVDSSIKCGKYTGTGHSIEQTLPIGFGNTPQTLITRAVNRAANTLLVDNTKYSISPYNEAWPMYLNATGGSSSAYHSVRVDGVYPDDELTVYGADYNFLDDTVFYIAIKGDYA